jgi:hypothetical protein
MKTASALILVLVILTGVGLALSNSTPPTSAAGSQVYTPPELSSTFSYSSTEAELSTSLDPQSTVLPVTQPSAFRLERVGQIGGVTYAVTVSGGRAYMGIGPHLAIMDVSNPTYPLFLGQSDILGAFVRDVAVRGNYAYVANGVAGLHIFDITNPAHPLEVGSYDTPGWSVGVDVSGNYAYVTDGDNGLLVFDIVNPAHPLLIGHYTGAAYRIALAGKYAFVVSGNALHMINIADPTHPYEARSYTGDGYESFDDVAVAGNYVYTFGNDGDLEVNWGNLYALFFSEDPPLLAAIGTTDRRKSTYHSNTGQPAVNTGVSRFRLDIEW